MIENQKGKENENLLTWIETGTTGRLGITVKDRTDMTDLTAVKGSHIGGIGIELDLTNDLGGQGVDLGLQFHLGMLATC